VGRVLGSLPDGRFSVEAKNRFSIGEELELLHPGKPGIPFTVTAIENEQGEPLSGINLPRAHVTVSGTPLAEKGDLLRKRCGRDG